MVERRSPKPEVAGSIPVAPAKSICGYMSKINEVIRFYDQVKQEVTKVTWPSKSELLNSTMMVLVVVILFSLVCLGIDYCINTVIQYLLKIGK